MDGNGRWARRRGLPTAAGHRAGTRALRRTVEAAIDVGIRHIVVYAFSTENWSRPQDEVDALMEIFGETIERELPDLAEQGVRVRFIGCRDRAPAALRARMSRWMGPATELNGKPRPGGSRSTTATFEPVEAARGLLKAASTRGRSTRTLAHQPLCTRASDPDLLIRTSWRELGASRNFMLWQLTYADFACSSTGSGLDFDGRSSPRARVSAQRRRRFGGR